MSKRWVKYLGQNPFTTNYYTQIGHNVKSCVIKALVDLFSRGLGSISLMLSNDCFFSHLSPLKLNSSTACFYVGILAASPLEVSRFTLG